MKKALLIALPFIALGVGMYVIAFHDIGRQKIDRMENENTIQTDKDTGNSDPASDKDTSSESSNEHEDQDTDNQEQEEVNVVLTRVSVDEHLVTVAGYANNPDAGECTLVLTSSTTTEQYTNPTEENPTNPDIVNCSTFRVPKSDLSSADKWIAQIFYESDRHNGVSQEWEFEL